MGFTLVLRIKSKQCLFYCILFCQKTKIKKNNNNNNNKTTTTTTKTNKKTTKKNKKTKKTKKKNKQKNNNAQTNKKRFLDFYPHLQNKLKICFSSIILKLYTENPYRFRSVVNEIYAENYPLQTFNSFV